MARRPDGALLDAKLLSENPSVYEDAALAGIRGFLGLRPDEVPPAGAIEIVRMGTTVATNALLERRGARTLLLVTRGFGDLLTIGNQSRPHLFALDVRRAGPLAERVVAIGGRLSPDGMEIEPLDELAARAALQAARRDGLESCAVALMHGWAHPRHEVRLGELAAEAGFAHVSLGHRIDPSLRLVPRAGTTVVDAYLSPVLDRHVERLHRALPGVRLHFMQSHGGLVGAAQFMAKDAILSGPAGGVVGAIRTARAAGFDRIVGFDMGGTSTDVSLNDAAIAGMERMDEAVVAGVSIRAPMMAIHTVAAGGGSIVRFDGERLRVGPESAGADPGPAAYRRGGPLTITDANILLGRIRPERFPYLFGPDGAQPLDTGAVQSGFAALAAQLDEAGMTRSAHEIAAGAIEIAVQQMAGAIRRISLERGRDTAGFTLVCFGGAGGQHACQVADELGLERIFIHAKSGLLSAYGMGLADQSSLREHAVETALSEPMMPGLLQVADELAQEAVRALQDDGNPAAGIVTRHTVRLRYEATESWLPVPLGSIDEMRRAFTEAHRIRFGFATPERTLIVQAIEAEAIAPGETLAAVPSPVPRESHPAPDHHAPVWIRGAWHATPVFVGTALHPGDRIAGPALIVEANATTLVDAGWRADATTQALVLHRHAAPAMRASPPAEDSARPDPIRLALFNNIFMSVAEQMGTVLAGTALSVNIRERLDFSCAVFDRAGRLIANAPHVPVHLGAMGESVRRVIASRGTTLRPGDAVALNDPYAGGTHLPDITVITPVFDADGAGPLLFVGSRGHHADIGGITPGSVPPFSTRLEEEGVVIDDFLLLDQGVFREQAFRDLLAAAAYPARNPDMNVADIKAQIAANAAGAAGLARVAARHGWRAIQDYAGHVMDNAERAVRRLIDRLQDGARDYPLDDGSMLRLAVTVDHDARTARIDFTGTDAQRPGNFNAPPAVVRASILYVLRCLVDDDIPLNDGCMRPIEIIVPRGSFLDPHPGAAVVSGNTELSQAVANALLGAIGACASAQGTMNNLTFGDATRQYYETIGGGTGAGPTFDGAGGVQSHMTNTRMTDPEVLELRHPVRVEEFGLRAGSGGAGLHRGGDGLVRRLRFLQPMTVMLVSSRRTVAPFGLADGAPGAVGEQWIDRADGTRDVLEGVAQANVSAGDVLTIATPGGGGYGLPAR